MRIPWYHTTTIYQIYPRSFYDSNGDGIGDLQGIIQQLDYIQDLGFETIWVSPFFASPQADFGYDISDYTDIAPEFGTMKDAFQLIEETHKRGMRFVLDMVMNHTSIEHPWFRESRSSRDNPKADWYIWRDKTNNWQSMTGGSGWHYAEERGQYYWASYLPFQPDLNYRNPEVKRAMFDIIRFWLGKGVDGFRLDIFNVIYKDAEFHDNPFAFKIAPKPDDQSGFFQEAKYTANQPEAFQLAIELRELTEEFGEKLTLGEMAGSRSVIRKFLGGEKNNGLTLSFDFAMLKLKFTAAYFHALIQDIETSFPPPFMPVYVFSNLDKRRSLNRLGNDVRKARLLHMLQLTVRGVPCMYYGEEIGMTDSKIPFDSALDPIAHKFKSVPRFVFDLLGVTINRDDVRTPMQWDGTKNAGFSSAQKAWLPVHENYREVNVKKQSGEASSLLSTIRALLRIRKEEIALHEGSLELMDGLPHGILGYRRQSEDTAISILLNFTEGMNKIPFDAGEAIFHLTGDDYVQDGVIQLGKFGGLLIKSRG